MTPELDSVERLTTAMSGLVRQVVRQGEEIARLETVLLDLLQGLSGKPAALATTYGLDSRGDVVEYAEVPRLRCGCGEALNSGYDSGAD